MCRAPSRLILPFLLLTAFALLACSLPASIAQSLTKETLTQTPTATISATSAQPGATPSPEVTSYPGLETAYPAPETVYPGPGLETPYPGSSGLPPYPGAEQVSPYPGLSAVSPTFQTSPPPTTLPSAQTTTPTASAEPSSYPPPGSGGYPPPVAGDLPYPGPQPLSPYPGLASPIAPAGSPGPLPTITLPPGTPLPAPTQAVFVTPTPTVFPTPTRFLTPTPTLTRTPTRTPTPLPPPPWVSAQLYATAPSTVLLASGEVQLVEFFAFWSGPSQAMAPIVQSLEEEYEDRILFTYLDIDDPATEAFQSQLDFQVEPHFFLLDPQGRILDEWIGYVTAEQFHQAFLAALTP